MRISFDGEMFRASHITGPTHNYLAMVVLANCPTEGWPLVEHMHENEQRRLESSEVRGWIEVGVRRANEALGTAYGIVRAEFVISDSRYPAIYSAMAEKIVLTAHSSPEPDILREGT